MTLKLRNIRMRDKNTFTFQYNSSLVFYQKEFRDLMDQWCKESFIGHWELCLCYNPDGAPFLDGAPYFTVDKLVIDNDIDVTTFTLKWL